MLRNFLKVLSGEVFAKLLGLLTIVFLAKYMEPTAFGQYNYIITSLGLLAIITQPFSSAYLREHRFNNFNKYDLTHNVIPLLLFIPFSIILLYWTEVNLSVLIIYFLLTLIFSFLSTYFNVYEKYFYYSILTLLKQTGIIFSIFISFYLLENNSVVSFVNISNLLTIIFFIIFASIYVSIKNVTWSFDLISLSYFFKHSKYLLLYWAMLPILNFLDMFFVKEYLSGEDLGFYSFSLKLFTISLVFLSPMTTVLRIKVIDIAKENGYYKYLRSNLRKILLASIVVYILSLSGTVIIYEFFFTEYIKGFSSSIVLITTSLISYVTIPFNFLMAYRKYKEIFILSIISIVVNIIVNYFFIPYFGMFAAAFSTFLAQGIINLGSAILSYVYFRKGKLK